MTHKVFDMPGLHRFPFFLDERGQDGFKSDIQEVVLPGAWRMPRRQ